MTDRITPERAALMRKASHLLPDPGGEVVRTLLDEIEYLRAEMAVVQGRRYRALEQEHE